MSPAFPSGQATEIHRLMSQASEAFNSNNMAAAERGCVRTLQLYPDFVPALHLLGLCLWQRGEFPEATDAMRRAADQAPPDARVLHDLGNLYFEQGLWQPAVQAYSQAIELAPARAESFLNLGVTCENLARYTEAERAYQRACELDSGLASAASSLAALAEGANRLEEAELWVTRALAQDAEDPVANLTRAQLDMRAGRAEAAAQRLEQLLQHPMSSRNRSLALARLGAVYEKRADYERAFTTFAASKQAMNLPGTAAAGPGIYTIETARRVARYQEALAAHQSGAAVETEPAPLFLVGFPRSGTTLLDQILSSHPRVTSLEEKDNLRDLLQDFVVTDAGLKRLVTLESSALDPYRKKYWARVAESFPERDASKLFIDKMPLNTLFMPLIACLFPAARYIFALRDPRDVVLSCFTRAFGLNEAMRHFLTLEGTAAYYAAVMGIGRRCLEQRSAAIHVLRYETLIDDTEGEARRLCEFMGVDWNPDMLKFQETARRRRINTPSYSQVVQPIYRSARARWRHYEKQLEPVLPTLQPFVEYFGYT